MRFEFLRKSSTDGRTRWLVTAGLLLLGLGAAQTDLGRKLEWKTEDERLKVRAQHGPAPHEALMLVAIDDASLEKIGQWPFERSMHGFLMDWLGKDTATRPAVLTWDLLFVDRAFDPLSDQALTAPLAGLSYPVVMGAATNPDLDEDAAKRGLLVEGRPGSLRTTLTKVSERPELESLPDQHEGMLPIPGLLETTRPAFLDADPDSDGIVRRLPLVVRVGDEVLPSLVLETLLAYWGVGPEAVTILPGEALEIKRPSGERVRVPIDAGGFYRLNYRHEVSTVKNPGGVPALGYHELYDLLSRKHIFADATVELPKTGGKILFVGQTGVGLTDIGTSPIRAQSAKVMVHLNALDNILRGDYLRSVPLWATLGGVLLVGLGLASMLDRSRLWTFAAASLALTLGLVALALGVLIAGSLMVPLAMPLAAFALQQGAFATLKVREEQARVREERAKRDRIRGMFATYVSPALVDKMVSSGKEPSLGGVEEEITAYFSDIESFSRFSEALAPTQLVDLMNEYLSACTDIVQAEGGTLDKYIGDALVAMYGAPLPLPNHGHRAVVAALRVHRRCDELRAKWQAEQATKNWPDIVTNLQTRIGLNLGRAVVGNMGSHTRFSYTMMGDTVNLAARMESGAKAYGVYTMVTESVVEASRRAEPDAVLFRPLDRIVVKGRTQPVAIYEAMALREDATPERRECARLFTEGLARYFARDWTGARRSFEASLPLEAHPKNNPSLVLLKRVADMEAHPPGPEWDGVYVMTSK